MSTTSVKPELLPKAVQVRKPAVEKSSTGEQSKPNEGKSKNKIMLFDIIDPFLRAPGRSLEYLYINDPITRPLIRLVSETVRHATIDILQSGKANTRTFIGFVKNFARSIKNSFPKIAENVGATIVFDPIKFTNPLYRIGAGFINTLSRLLIRTGLVTAGALQTETLASNSLVDEVFVKTFSRGISFGSGPVRFITMILEQMSINTIMRKLPLKKLFGGNTAQPVVALKAA